MTGPLSGTKVIEIAGIGPGPFCAMMLADMGAEVVRIDRRSAAGEGSKFDVLNRGRRSLALDLKKQAAVTAILRMVRRADALIEGFRPGVMERLGLGPDLCLERNPRLVYGRMTGWGQEGPLAQAAGHDINYISLTGALHAIGPTGGGPVPPLNLIGDFGGGGMLLAFGVVCAMLDAARSGKGQVVDAAMTDGSAALMAAVYGIKARGGWTNERGANLLDGGAPFYGTYQCKDGKWISVGSLEPQFYELLREKAGMAEPSVNDRWSKDSWAGNRTKLGQIFKTKTQAEWCALMEGSDVCFAPILDLDEAPRHPHNKQRQTFVDVDGVTQPAPAPRFSRTPGAVQAPPPKAGEHSEAVLRDWGFSTQEISDLRAAEAV
ncbi:MAG TPA: CaiB/BaiF CoA-transferase family protein [Thermoanaerobaculia bacterium]|nr:CaiB/BaiF CoA-transferase family protein [Thermoanaerobaculia bacterium]